MRITRIVAGAVTAGLLGVTPIALTAPAHADGQTYTPTVLAELHATTSPLSAPYAYGGGFYVSGKVADPHGGYDNSGGVAYLQVRTPANPVWTTVAEDTSPSYLFFDAGFRFTSDAELKVYFAGAPAQNAWTDTLLPAESAVITAPVTRKVVFKNPRGTLIKGKVSPDYKKSPIKIHRKAGKKWVKYRTVKTTARSTYRFTLPAPRRGRTQWLITIPGGRDFTDWQTKGYTYSTRTAVSPRAARFR